MSTALYINIYSEQSTNAKYQSKISPKTRLIIGIPSLLASIPESLELCNVSCFPWLSTGLTILHCCPCSVVGMDVGAPLAGRFVVVPDAVRVEESLDVEALGGDDEVGPPLTVI